MGQVASVEVCQVRLIERAMSEGGVGVASEGLLLATDQLVSWCGAGARSLTDSARWLLVPALVGVRAQTLVVSWPQPGQLVHGCPLRPDPLAGLSCVSSAAEGWE